MRKILWALCSGSLLLTTSTAFAVDFPEVEPNNIKSTATVAAGMANGDTLSGTTTGSSTTVAGLGSADAFKVSTAAASLGVYRHRLTIASTPAGHTTYIMGVAAAGAASEITAAQTSSTTSTVVRSNQWYGFGRQEQIYYRVVGTTTTTAGYTVTLSDLAIVPTAVAGTITPGSVTISTVGQGHSTDTEMALYDSGFNILRWNDDEPTPGTTLQSKIVQTLSPGTYYLGVTRFNMFLQQALEANDRDTTGNRLDFADGIGSSSASTTASGLSFAITSGAGTVTQAAAIAESYEVKWFSFVVTDPTGACCFNDGSCTEVAASACITAGGAPQAGGTTCSPNPCPQPQGCCLASGVCFVALPGPCSSAGGNPTGNPDCGTVHTYSSSPGTVIADNLPWGPDTIAIGDSYYVGDVNVSVDIRHTFLGDLNITIGHGATNVQIWSGDCGGNDNLNATADDQAANIACATPTTASWNPNSATAGQFLSAFAGVPVTGNWTISGADTASGDTGVLNSWTLTIGEYCLPITPVRCCFPDGSCQDLLGSSCTGLGGTPDALGTSCPGTPACVDFREACCFGDGSCQYLLTADCTTAGGTSQGVGTNCGSVSCPDLREACCFSDTSCQLLLSAACTTAGGTPQGAGTNCGSVSCPNTNPGQSCLNPIAVDIPGGLPYTDANTTCGKINDYSNTCLGSYDSGEDIIYRLDVSDPVCLTITLDGSVVGGSIWLGMGLDDSCPLGALAGDCIALGTTSAAIDVINVSLNPGTYYLMIDTFASPNCAAYSLSITECPTVACCVAGVCSDLNVPDCNAAGGTSQGSGSACATAECPNACCFATGACTYVSATACATAGGTAGAIGSNCTPNNCPQPGACCFGDGSCQFLLPAACQVAGGSFVPNATCNPYYTVATIAPALVDLTTSGTATLLDYGTDDDDGQISVALPFAFSFYGNSYNSLLVSTNGYVTFSAIGDDFSNDNPIPNTLTPNDAIYPLWDDFDLDGVDKIYWDVQGAIGNRVFIAEWVNVGQYNSGSPPLDSNTFEVKLFEADGCIEFHYGTITPEGTAPSTPAGTDYTIGVENSTGTVATQIQGADIGAGNTARRLCFNSTGPCPQPEACCTNGVCTMALAAACSSGGGTPQGAGTNCGSVVCPQPDGCLGILVGDANCDGSVNNFDIDFFVQGVLFPTGALPDVPPTAPGAYLASGGTEACWAKRRCWGDINCDGASNNFDIDPFVACILATPLPGQPCQVPSVCLPEACCFPGGSCAMIRPAGCVLSGGTPQGNGSLCGVVVCP